MIEDPKYWWNHWNPQELSRRLYSRSSDSEASLVYIVSSPGQPKLQSKTLSKQNKTKQAWISILVNSYYKNNWNRLQVTSLKDSRAPAVPVSTQSKAEEIWKCLRSNHFPFPIASQPTPVTWLLVIQNLILQTFFSLLYVLTPHEIRSKFFWKHCLTLLYNKTNENGLTTQENTQGHLDLFKQTFGGCFHWKEDATSFTYRRVRLHRRA